MAATTTTPLPMAYATALLSTLVAASAPRLMLITCAPLSAAQRIAAATSAEDPTPDTRPSLIRTIRVRALTGMILVCQPTPATWTPLFDRAAMVPDTCVP